MYLFSTPLFLFVLTALLCCVNSIDQTKELTFKVKPGSVECFFQTVEAGDGIEMEYQVTDGEHGELDIDFYLHEPRGTVIQTEVRSTEKSVYTTFTEAGDYKFCWDNTFSRFSHKTIFLAFSINPANKEQEDQWRGATGGWDDGEFHEMKMEDIKDAVDRIRSYLSKARIHQDHISSLEARDRNIAENVYSRVNMFSCISLIVMLSTGVIQVVLLRSLFDDKSKLHKIWNRNGTSKF